MKIKKSIDSVFNAQKKWFHSGYTLNIADRLKALARLKDMILEHKMDIYSALENDLGKTADIVDLAEIGAVLDEIDVTLAELDKWVEDEVIPLTGIMGGSQGKICHEPYGVCYIIGPFNYPFNLTITPLVGAIAAGNTAILKPSEATPKTSGVIKKIIEKAFPPEYVTVIEGGREENTLLMRKPFDFYFFTGSPAVGKMVMKAAADNLSPVVLELGGKCPVVVFEDADLGLLVERLAFTKYLNSGQTCVAPDYLLVPESMHDHVMLLLKVWIEDNYAGKSIGKIVNEKQIEKLAGYLRNTRGKVLTGGTFDLETRQFSPTIVTGVDWDDSLMQEEIFGPILPVLTYRSLDECRQKITAYHAKPLAVYVFSRDISGALKFIKTVQSGDAQINDILTHALSSQLPFGGIGCSGIGKYHGKASFLTYSHTRSVRIVAAE